MARQGVQNNTGRVQQFDDIINRRKSQGYNALGIDIMKCDKVRELEIFRDLNPNFVSCVIDDVDCAIFKPGETILAEGCKPTECYILMRGEVSVEVAEKKVAKLGAGSLFGEIALLGLAHGRTANVVATTFCDTRVIHAEKFREALKKFPAEREHFRKKGKERMQEIAKKKAETTSPTKPSFYQSRRTQSYRRLMNGIVGEVLKDKSPLSRTITATPARGCLKSNRAENDCEASACSASASPNLSPMTPPYPVAPPRSAPANTSSAVSAEFTGLEFQALAIGTPVDGMLKQGPSATPLDSPLDTPKSPISARQRSTTGTDWECKASAGLAETTASSCPDLPPVSGASPICPNASKRPSRTAALQDFLSTADWGVSEVSSLRSPRDSEPSSSGNPCPPVGNRTMQRPHSQTQSVLPSRPQSNRGDSQGSGRGTAVSSVPVQLGQTPPRRRSKRRAEDLSRRAKSKESIGNRGQAAVQEVRYLSN